MTVIDEALLADVRGRPCVWCLFLGQTPRPGEPHHIQARGMGGGSRLDVPENVVPLCREHHQSAHDRGYPARIGLFHLAGKRIGKTAGECQARVYELLRTPRSNAD